MNGEESFFIQKGNIYAIPIIHYNMEMAAQVLLAFKEIQPDCVAVEFPETMQLQILHAASRLPDLSVVQTFESNGTSLYYMAEPCDAAFEALRSAQDANIPAFCIDLDVENYPDVAEPIPDPYAIQRITLKQYYNLYEKSRNPALHSQLDKNRELYMAKRLKELGFTYDKILFVGGMSHIQSVLELIDRSHFPAFEVPQRETIQLCTLTEDSAREVMAECGWISKEYEKLRSEFNEALNNPLTPEAPLLAFPPDRQKLIYQLFKEASVHYLNNTGHKFHGYHLRALMKFVRNYALIKNQLMPSLFQLLSAAKGCVDHNYAYEVWALATEYLYRRNIDSLPELSLKIEDVWGPSKIIRFHMKLPGRKNTFFTKRRKDRSTFKFQPPSPFSICSYPPEDIAVENFGDFLKKKGKQVLLDESSRTRPFSTSLEEGIDTRETIRHWHEKKIFVKVRGKPPEGVGSVVIIFDEDQSEDPNKNEKYPWRTTWLGEHDQESDMAFYATPMTENVVGPGISRCEYGGFMMSYPPRRMFDVWTDPDYAECRSKAEVLLMAAIDYAVKPLITYVANKPPRSFIKSFANRYGKKIVYVPYGQLSPITLNKLRVFHVLSGRDKRDIAGEYIF